jgi:hypothetical protein
MGRRPGFLDLVMTTVPPMIDFETFKARCAVMDAAVARASARLREFPSGPRGWTPDAVKASPEYRAAKAAYVEAFEASRAFNGAHAKRFAVEIKTDIQAQREARLAAPKKEG